MTSRSPDHSLRRLIRADGPAYRALMLEAYERHPEAFTSTVEERAERPLAWWCERLDEGARPAQVVFGVDRGDELIGVAGLAFAQRLRTRHKAKLFGMYVRSEQRGEGVGRELVEAVLEYARQRPGLRTVHLTVTAENAAARRLYERCGFETFGREPMAVASLDSTGWHAKVYLRREL